MVYSTSWNTSHGETVLLKKKKKKKKKKKRRRSGRGV
jgi:hypothetical protein